jgi:hypothetical protein
MYLTSRRHLPTITELHQYWLARRGERLMPRRADIDPAHIAALLPHIALVDIEHEPFRVRYRVVGTKMVEYCGHDFTGLYLDEVKFSKPDELLALYRRAATERAPTFRSTNWRSPDGAFWALENAILPLSEDDVLVTQCLAIEDMQDSRTVTQSALTPD